MPKWCFSSSWSTSHGLAGEVVAFEDLGRHAEAAPLGLRVVHHERASSTSPASGAAASREATSPAVHDSAVTTTSACAFRYLTVARRSAPPGIVGMARWALRPHLP